jgi:hypothetical protein
MTPAEIAEELGFGPADMARRAEQTEQAQQARWGKTGLAILGIDEDEESAKRDAEWAATSILDDLDDLFADL